MKEKFIISVKGDCNDADYLTELTVINAELLDARRLKELLKKLKNVDEVADYDTYNYDKILEELSIDDFIEIDKILNWEIAKEEVDAIKSSKDELRDFINNILYEFLPIEWQSGQLCHNIIEVRLLKEII